MSNLKELDEVKKILKEEIAEIWRKEPIDVRTMREGNVKGAYLNICSPILYAESETREMIDYLWNIKTLIEQDKIDLYSAKSLINKIMDFKLQKWLVWYHFRSITNIMKEVEKGIERSSNKEELLSVLSLFQIFIGKINFWLDSLIPWQNISSVFDLIYLNK